jgi:hypothetical protein
VTETPAKDLRRILTETAYANADRALREEVRAAMDTIVDLQGAEILAVELLSRLLRALHYAEAERLFNAMRVRDEAWLALEYEDDARSVEPRPTEEKKS